MKNGFTLVEVAVAIALAAITVLPAISLLLHVQQSALESDRALRATSIGQSIMERFVKTATVPSASPSTPVDADFSYRIDVSSGTEATANAQVHVYLNQATEPYCSLYTVVRRQK